jgi:protein-disulfide isomerase
MTRVFIPLAFVLAGCHPLQSSVEKAVAQNPEIVISAMKANPELFMRAFTDVATAVRVAEEKQAAEDERERAELERRHPLAPVIDASRAADGARDARITIVEYADFECPYCRRGSYTLRELQKRYPGQVRIIMKHRTNPALHEHAQIAATFYEAVALQSQAKAIAFRHELFAGQEELSLRGEDFLREKVVAVGADLHRVLRDRASDVVRLRLKADSAEAARFNITGTPVYVVNGMSVRGAYPLQHFVQLIEGASTASVGD